MNFETAKKIFGKLAESAKKNKYKGLDIAFLGGECLLEIELLKKIVRLSKLIAKEADLEVVFSIVTNGVLINEPIAKFLKNNNISARVSLDGLGKYNSARVFPSGKSSFKYVWRGIEIFKKFGVDFEVGITISKKNMKGVDKLVKRLIKKDIRFKLGFVKEHGGGLGQGLKMDKRTVISKMRQIFKLIEKEIDQKSKVVELVANLIEIKPGIRFCGAGRHFAAIDCQGRIATCPMIFDQIVGDVNQGDIVKIIREKTVFKPKDLTVIKKQPCNKCIWRYICQGDCPVGTWAVTGKYDVASPFCEVYKALMPDILRLEAARIVARYRAKMY